MKEKVQKWLATSFSDPIAKILMKNSHLTRAQTETLVIDLLAEKVAEKRITYEEKAKLRQLRSGVSRGAFNRTLRQARKNVIKSIYTVSLLGYLGMLESPRLDAYLELTDRLHRFSDAYKEILRDAESPTDAIRLLSALEKQLEDGLRHLANPSAMSDRT